MLIESRYVCPHCAQASETAVDPSQGDSQRYVEDCQVCCRPLRLEVTVAGDDASIHAFPENE